eukprot:snap_masked-scaffold_23-processed-gene-0.38-mRNA-1 protein AED:1.00 eAED:1.00 QI:0/-1/0/0/-1/1/1/0/73
MDVNKLLDEAKNISSILEKKSKRIIELIKLARLVDNKKKYNRQGQIFEFFLKNFVLVSIKKLSSRYKKGASTD